MKPAILTSHCVALGDLTLVSFSHCLWFHSLPFSMLFICTGLPLASQTYGLVPILQSLQELSSLSGKAFTQPFSARLDPPTITIRLKVPLQTGLVLFSVYSLSTPFFISLLSLSKIIQFIYLPHELPHWECHLLQRSPFSLLHASA